MPYKKIPEIGDYKFSAIRLLRTAFWNEFIEYEYAKSFLRQQKIEI